MTYGSLFTGIGGIDLGLDAAGFHCRWQVENDPYAVKVLEKHWPTVKRYGDICSIDGSELEPVDLVCGGFPCQDLSQAGKRVGIEGTRSGLWFEYARLVGELGPRYVLIENVPGLLVSDAMRRVIGELARCGYVGCWRSLRASEFGASHLRKRVFIVAHGNGERCGEARELRRGEIALSGGIGNDVLAHGTRGGLRELRRQPSGSNGLTDGSNEELGDAESLDRRRELEAGSAPGTNGQNGRCGSSGADRPLDDSQLPRLEIRDRQREQHLRQDAESLAPGLQPHLADPAAYDERDGSIGQTGGAGAGRRGIGTGSGRLQVGVECGVISTFAPGPSDPRWPIILRERPDLAPALESPLRRVADGIPNLLDGAMSSRTKRLGRLGNAVVPQIAEWIGGRILEFDKELTYG